MYSCEEYELDEFHEAILKHWESNEITHANIIAAGASYLEKFPLEYPPDYELLNIINDDKLPF